MIQPSNDWMQQECVRGGSVVGKLIQDKLLVTSENTYLNNWDSFSEYMQSLEKHSLFSSLQAEFSRVSDLMIVCFVGSWHVYHPKGNHFFLLYMSPEPGVCSAPLAFSNSRKVENHHTLKLALGPFLFRALALLLAHCFINHCSKGSS